MEHRRAILLLVALGGGFAMGIAARWPSLAVAVALGDAMGPWWSAARADLLPPPHAAIYGGALAWPHRAILVGASSLWSAFAALFAVQALVAPAAGLLAWRRVGRLAPAVVVGMLAALDPGLLDTTVSGSKGYLAALWIGGLAIAATARGPAAGLGPLAFGLAVANHPLAICAAPLLALLPRTRFTAAGLVVVLPALAPQVLRVIGADAGGGGAGLAAPVQALGAWLSTEGAMAAALVGGLLVGARDPRTRPQALATAASLALLLLAGGGIGYLRDHHLRLLALPALAGLAALPGWTAWLPLLALRPPTDPVSRPSEARRPGTLGLETRLALTLAARAERPLVVDGVWVSGAPAAEPGALLLDLWLRGEPASALAPGGAVALVVTAERADLGALPAWPGLSEIARDDRLVVLLGSPAAARDWTAALCSRVPPPRLGGAWDGLAVLHPSLGAEAATGWLGCAGR